MRRCQHFCGCEGNPVGRDPETELLLCAGCLGRSILGTDCSRARKYFGHMPARFGAGAWDEPPPLRDGDRSAPPAEFEGIMTIRTGFDAPPWDFMPLAVGPGAGAEARAGTFAGSATGTQTTPGASPAAMLFVRSGPGTATNPHRPPKDPPPGPLPPPPGRPVQPNPPRR